MDAPCDPAETRLDLMTISDRLSDPLVEQYLSGNRHRLATTRALLEMLRIPFPAWAERGVNGRADATKAAIDRFKADHPQEQLPRGYQPPKSR